MSDVNIEPIIAALQRGAFIEAEKNAVKLVQKAPLYGQGWVLLGQSLMFQGYGKWASRVFQRALLLDPVADWAEEIDLELSRTPAGSERKDIELLLDVPAVSVSAAMIVKNESRCIARCIESLDEAVDEIIVVDTGSTDDTVNIASQYPNVKVYHFDWVDDFAAARNYSLSLVNTRWVFMIDADEYLRHDDINAIREVSGLYDPISTNFTLCPKITGIDANGTSVSGMDMPRLFRADVGMKFVGRIHEQLCSSDGDIYGNKLLRRRVNIRLWHDGYTAEVRSSKHKDDRDLGLLLKMIDESPEDPCWLFLYGRELVRLGRFDEAIEVLGRTVVSAKKEPGFGRIQDVYKHLAIAYLELGKLDDAQSVCNEAISEDGLYPDIKYHLANAEVSKALQMYRSASSDLKLARESFNKYGGAVPPDSQIINWKADLATADLMRLTGELSRGKLLYQRLQAQSTPLVEEIDKNIDYIDNQIAGIIDLIKAQGWI